MSRDSKLVFCQRANPGLWLHREPMGW